MKELKVCIFLAEGFEEIEALATVDVLRRAKIDIQIVSITGDKVVTSSHKVKVIADALFEEIDYSMVDMLVLPGGMPGTNNLQAYEPLRNLITKFNQEGKLLAAICAAPKIFAELGLLDNKEAICYPEYEKELNNARLSTSKVVTDGNIITGKGAGVAFEFGLEILRKFKPEEYVLELKRKMIL